MSLVHRGLEVAEQQDVYLAQAVGARRFSLAASRSVCVGQALLEGLEYLLVYHADLRSQRAQHDLPRILSRPSPSPLASSSSRQFMLIRFPRASTRKKCKATKATTKTYRETQRFELFGLPAVRLSLCRVCKSRGSSCTQNPNRRRCAK